MANITTTRQLQAEGRYWQKEYGLQGWDITFEFVNHPDEIGGNDALTTWSIETSSALIQIVRPRHNGKSTLQRLLHELHHCRIPLYPEDELARQIFEAGIDATASVLHRQIEKTRMLMAIVKKLHNGK